MQPSPNHTIVRRNSRIRIAAGLVSFVLASIYTLQFGAALDRSTFLGGLFISFACLHVIYGTMVLTQSWAIDSIGKAHPDAAMRSRRWYEIGIGGNLILVLVLIASLIGAIPTLSNDLLELLAIMSGSVLIAILFALVRLTR